MTASLIIAVPDSADLLDFLAPNCFRCQSIVHTKATMLYSGYCDTGILWLCTECGGEQYLAPGSQVSLFVPHEEWERRRSLTAEQRREEWDLIRDRLWPDI